VSDVLRVSGAGLQALATHCGAVSAGLVAGTPISSARSLNQATSSAVGTAYTALEEAITVLAGRAQASAVMAGMAGTEFAATDSAGAQQVVAIGASTKQV
jgi:hypothetical protein